MSDGKSEVVGYHQDRALHKEAAFKKQVCCLIYCDSTQRSSPVNSADCITQEKFIIAELIEVCSQIITLSKRRPLIVLLLILDVS